MWRNNNNQLKLHQPNHFLSQHFKSTLKQFEMVFRFVPFFTAIKIEFLVNFLLTVLMTASQHISKHNRESVHRRTKASNLLKSQKGRKIVGDFILKKYLCKTFLLALLKSNFHFTANRGLALSHASEIYFDFFSLKSVGDFAPCSTLQANTRWCLFDDGTKNVFPFPVWTMASRTIIHLSPCFVQLSSRTWTFLYSVKRCTASRVGWRRKKNQFSPLIKNRWFHRGRRTHNNRRFTTRRSWFLLSLIIINNR